jgi:hypothetical protein
MNSKINVTIGKVKDGNMKKLQNLMEYVKDVEHEVAYGSETIWWGKFLDNLWEQYPETSGYFGDEDTEIMVDDEFYQWWETLYQAVEDIENIENLTSEEEHNLVNYGDGDDFIKVVNHIVRSRE